MNTLQILKKTWGLVWHYRALWLFGGLLALTTNNALWLGMGRNSEGFTAQNQIILSDTATINFPGEGITIDFRSPGAPIIQIEGLEPGWYRDLIEDASLSDVWALLISIGIMILITLILGTAFRYTSEATLIRMVDAYERSEKMASVRQGLRLGWSRVAGKLFLIDLAIFLPMILIFVLLFFLVTSPLFLFGLESIPESVPGIVGIALLVLAGLLLFTFLASAAALTLSITRPVMHQACAVDGLNVGTSIRQGFVLLKTRFIAVILTWLVWLAVRLAWMIAVIPVTIILFPVILLTLLVGIMIGTMFTLMVAGIASQFVSTVFAWVVGVIFALPLVALVAFSPITFLSGLVEVFKSSFWTLSYQEIRPLTGIVLEPEGEPGQDKLSAVLVQ